MGRSGPGLLPARAQGDRGTRRTLRAWVDREARAQVDTDSMRTPRHAGGLEGFPRWAEQRWGMGSRAWGHRSHQTWWPLRGDSWETEVGDPVPGWRVREVADPSPSPALLLTGPALLQHGHTLLTTGRWLKDMQWGQKSGGGRGPTLCPPVPAHEALEWGPLQPSPVLSPV